MGNSVSGTLNDAAKTLSGSSQPTVPFSALQAACLYSDIDTTKVDVGQFASRIRAAQEPIPTDSAKPVHMIRDCHDCYVRVLVWDPFRDLLISGGGDGWIRLWSTHDYSFAGELDAKLSVRALLVLTQELASGHSNGQVIVWNLEKDGFPKVQTLQGEAHGEAVYALAMLPNGDLISGAEDIRVFTRSMFMGFQLKLTISEEVLCMCTVPSNGDTHVVTGNMNSDIMVWDTVDWNAAAECHGHTRSVWSICYIRDVHRCASGSADHSIRIWDPAGWTCEKVLKDHAGWVVGLCGAPGSLLSCSIDQGIRLWDHSSWTCQRHFTDHEYEVYCVCTFAGGRFAAGGAEMAILVYGGHEHAKDDENILQRALVPRERQQTPPKPRGPSTWGGINPVHHSELAHEGNSAANDFSWLPQWLATPSAGGAQPYPPPPPDPQPYDEADLPPSSELSQRQRRNKLMALSELDITMSEFHNNLVPMPERNRPDHNGPAGSRAGGNCEGGDRGALLQGASLHALEELDVSRDLGPALGPAEDVGTWESTGSAPRFGDVGTWESTGSAPRFGTSPPRERGSAPRSPKRSASPPVRRLRGDSPLRKPRDDDMMFETVRAVRFAPQEDSGTEGVTEWSSALLSRK